MKKSTAVILVGKKRAGALLPPLSSADNKVSRGKSLLLAGSEEYPGAGVLAAKAALRMGSGYVILAQRNIAVSRLENPDFLLCDLNKKSWHKLSVDAILVGPGFGVNDFTAQVIHELKQQKNKAVILDADALTVCARDNIFPLPATWIVTPHEGELARCLKVSAEEIRARREFYVRKAEELFKCVVVLKGHGTLIASGERVYQIQSGNEALAKAGTGDVLAGTITALRAQGFSAVRAAVLGAYIHGATANLWQTKRKDLLSMTASDVIELLPEVLYRVREDFEKTSRRAE